METVSIIVPVFNGEAYLSACLDSLLAQTLRDLRVYLIDDGSTDRTPAVCGKYSALDGRITHIRQENRGVSAARNAGLRLARGEFVTFCDADDLWEREHLQTLVRAIRETGADMVSCNYTLVDGQGNFLRRTAFPAELRELASREETVNYMLDVLAWRTGWAVWARMFRRDAVCGLRFCEAVALGEDLLFVLEAALSCRRVVSIPGGGCCYRQHPGSAMTRAWDVLSQRAAVAYRLRQRHPQLEAAVFWEILRPGLEEIPAAKLPEALARLPEKPWILEIARRVDSPLARFCCHGNVLRYRIEKKLDV